MPPVPANIDELELMALEKRPEIMEEWYRRRVTENDIKAAGQVAVVAESEPDAGWQYDSNKYNYNSDWTDVGLQAVLEHPQTHAVPVAAACPRTPERDRRHAPDGLVDGGADAGAGWRAALWPSPG